MARCRYCKVTIKWVQTTAGKKMPCDPSLITLVLNPKETGGERLTVVTPAGDTLTGYAPTGPTSLDDVVTGYSPHWATCPHATKARDAARQGSLF